jgi:hypothetical protein
MSSSSAQVDRPSTTKILFFPAASGYADRLGRLAHSRIFFLCTVDWASSKGEQESTPQPFSEDWADRTR